MIVISDTTAISSLFKIHKLDLLHQLYKEILIPTAVFEELKGLEAFGLDISEIKTSSWIRVKMPNDHLLIAELAEELDIGESEAIVLAKEVKADLLIIDEKRGRLKANELGIPTSGLIGLITQLKRQGKISAVKPLLDELRSTGFWIQESFYNKILQSEGE